MSLSAYKNENNLACWDQKDQSLPSGTKKISENKQNQRGKSKGCRDGREAGVQPVARTSLAMCYPIDHCDAERKEENKPRKDKGRIKTRRLNVKNMHQIVSTDKL